MGGPCLSLYPCRQEGKHKVPWETQPSLMAKHKRCCQSGWRQVMNSERSANHSEVDVWCIKQPEIKLFPVQRKRTREEALEWKYIAENKSLCHRGGSHGLFVLPTTWTQSLQSNRNAINIVLLWWAAVALTSIPNCCIWFGALSYLCYLCKARTPNPNHRPEQTHRANRTGLLSGPESGACLCFKSAESGAKGRAFSP